MRLVAVELRRFAARRLVRVLLLVGVVATVATVTILASRSARRAVVSTSSPPATVARCPAVPTGPCTTVRAAGSTVAGTTPLLVRSEPRLHVGDQLEGAVDGSGIGLFLLGVVLGASFLGAELAAGSLGSQLLYEPRRGRVFGAKVLAAGVGAAIVALVLLVVIAASLWAGSAARGLVAGIDATWWRERTLEVLRVAGTAGLGAVLALSLTAVARRSAAAVAVVFALGFVVERLLMDNVGWLDSRLPVSALIGLAFGDATAAGSRFDHLGPVAVVAGAWTVAIAVVGASVFVRREVR